MTKYSFLLLERETEDFLKLLQEIGLIDISRSRKAVDDKSAELFSKAESISKEIESIEKCDFSKDAIHTDLSIELKNLQDQLEEKSHWGDVNREHTAALEASGLKFYYFKVPEKQFNPAWASEYVIQEVERDGREVRFVAVEHSSSNSVPAAPIVVSDKSIDELSAEVCAVSKDLEDREAQILSRKNELPRLHKEFAEVREETERHLARSTSELAADNYIAVLTGFAPSREDTEVKAALDNAGIFYVAEPAKPEDNPPVKLRNNWFARNFETLTGMYGMPVYGEFDPTPILAPFFLLFWAFCMGDAGYGLVLIAVGFLVRKIDILGLKPHWRLVTTLGVGASVIGFFLATFFGVNLTEVSWIPDGLKRLMLSGQVSFGGSTYDIAMVAAIVIGVFHICLAMVVKAICLTHRFGFKEAISTWGWIVLIIGGLSVAAGALTSILDATATKWAVIVIGVVSFLGIFLFNKPGRNPLINIGAGLWDTYGMTTGIIGDVLSYIRLYALGLAGGMLGNAFNDLGKMALGDDPTWQWLPFALIVLLGHLLNFAMSCLGAFVHPLRLTFVEYFKNSGYEGKGNAYSPLKKEKSINQ